MSPISSGSQQEPQRRQSQIGIAAPKPVYSALHPYSRSFVLQDVKAEGELAAGQSSGSGEEPREPLASSDSAEKLFGPAPAIVFHHSPSSFHQQQLVLPAQMLQSHPPYTRIRSKTPPALFNLSPTTSRSLGHSTPSSPSLGGRPLPIVPLVSQASTSSLQSMNTNTDISHHSSSIITGPGSVSSTLPKSSASSPSTTSTASPHAHRSLPTTSIRKKAAPSPILPASGSSTPFPTSSGIMVFDGDNANHEGKGDNGGNATQGTQGAKGVTYSHAFHPNQTQSPSSSSSSAFSESAALSPPVLTSSSLSSPPLTPPSALGTMISSGQIPNASTSTKSGATSMESAGHWSVKGSNSNNNSAAVTNSSKINNNNTTNNSGSSTTANTALRPLPLPPGSTPRARTRSNNTTNVLSGPSGPYAPSVNVLSMPISWASRPVDLNRSVPASSGHSGGEQPGQQTQQGQGQQQKPYSRPPSRPSLRSSRPSSPSASSSPPPQPPSNLAFGPCSSSASSVSGANVSAGRSRSPPPHSKTITTAARSPGYGGRLRSKSASRPKAQASPGASASASRYESISTVVVAMGTNVAATATPPVVPNTAPPHARLAPQGSRRNPAARKRSATATSLVSGSSTTITKSQPVGSGLSALTTTTTTTTAPTAPATTTQPTTRQISTRLAITQWSPPPPPHLTPAPLLAPHHPTTSHGHTSPSGLTPDLDVSPLTSSSAPPPAVHTTTTQSEQRSGSTNTKRHQGGVQLTRQQVSRAAAVPAPLNLNYVGVARDGVYYVRDKDPYPYHQKSQDEKVQETSMDTGTMSKVRPLPQPAMVQPLLSDKQPEDGGKPTKGDDNDNDDDGISCLSYIDSPDSTIGVHPSLSFSGDDDIGLSEQEEPLLVYVDDNFDSSGEGEEFVKSVSPMRYARPGSAGTVDSGDYGSETSSDFFSDVDDPFKYNKGRSRRRGRTRTTVPVGRAGGGETPTEAAGSQPQKGERGTKGKPRIRMTESFGSMRELIESKAKRAEKDKRKQEAGAANPIAARTKSAERDRALPQRYGHPQESPLPPPPPRLVWFASTEAQRNSLNENVVGAGGGGGDKLISPVSLSSSQGGRSLSPMRYAKRMSVELLDDSSSFGSPISPVGTGGLWKDKYAKVGGGTKKGRKKRPQPWSYEFDYQGAKASSPFTFGIGGKESPKKEEEKKAEEANKRETAKSLKGFKTKEGNKKLSIDVLDISLLRPASHPTMLEAGTADAGDDVFGLSGGGGSGRVGKGSGGSGGSGRHITRRWDDSPSSSATASSFTVIEGPGTNYASSAHSSGHPPPPPSSTGTAGRTRTFKVRNP